MAIMAWRTDEQTGGLDLDGKVMLSICLICNLIYLLHLNENNDDINVYLWAGGRWRFRSVRCRHFPLLP